jgi:hypothetical protein
MFSVESFVHHTDPGEQNTIGLRDCVSPLTGNAVLRSVSVTWHVLKTLCPLTLKTAFASSLTGLSPPRLRANWKRFCRN